MSVDQSIEFYQLHQGAARKHANGYTVGRVTRGAAAFIQGEDVQLAKGNRKVTLDAQLPTMVVALQPDTHARVEP